MLKEIRVTTGIPGFDRLIEGGLVKNSINLLVADSGSGKSIFGTQFLMEGIKGGEKCLYITFEEKKDDFYLNMADFGWDLEKLEKEGKFIFLEYTPEKVRTMLEEGGGIIESIVLGNKVSRIVIDSITAFALLFEDELKKREAALLLFNMLRKWGCTTLLTSEESPFQEKKASSRTIEWEVDSVFAIYLIRDDRQRKRYLEILKMRGTNHAKEVYPIYIDNTGFHIEDNPYVGKLDD
jgi:circadian clock protein KaiC